MNNRPINELRSDNINMENLSRQELFNMSYQAQKDNFESSMKINKPSEISFEDKNEEGQIPIKNLDRIMSQTLADRERELNNITQRFSKNEKVKAMEWLNQNNENTNITISEETPKITIQEKTNVKLDVNNISPKRVTFNLDNEKPEKQYGRQKQETIKSENVKLEVSNNISNTKMESKLDMILSNQQMILEILKKNNLLDSIEEQVSHSDVVEFDAI
tara:strand:- start:1185 stop:1838 length:654 start_codon:yes stop_codon:yes gene_type:complete